MKAPLLATICLVAYTASTPTETTSSHSSHSPQDLSKTTSEVVRQGHSSHLPAVDLFALYKQVHEQLVQQAKLEAAHYAEASKSRITQKSHGRRPKSTSKERIGSKRAQKKGERRPLRQALKSGRIPMTEKERAQRRIRRAEVLGLHQNSPVPMFSLPLSVEELKKDPRVNDWQVHRQAIQDGDLKQSQLPPHFQPLRGTYSFPKGKIIAQQEKPEEVVRELAQKKDRVRRLKDLGLSRDSALPVFAQRLSRKELEKHPELTSWHHHREMIEKGTMKQEKLPGILRSTIPGNLDFKKGKTYKKILTPERRAHQTQSEKAQRRETNTKLVKLGLKRNSALPIFARNLAAENIEMHGEFDDWKRYRNRLEQGEITQKDLPDHFKPHRGILRLESEQGSSSVDNMHRKQPETRKEPDSPWIDTEEWDNLRAQLDNMYDSDDESNRLDFRR